MPDKLYASFIFLGKNLDPQLVTSLTGVAPSKSFKSGDVRHENHKWPHGYWELCSEGTIDSSDLSAHLEWLVNQMEPSTAAWAPWIEEQGFDAHLSCFWIFPSEHEEFSLSAQLLGRLASLGVRLDIDMYSP